MPGQGWETSWTNSSPWAPWVTVLLVLGAAAWTWWAYRPLRGQLRRSMHRTLMVCRFVSLLILLFMLQGWMVTRYKTDLPDLAIVIDVSRSMSLADIEDRVQDRIRAGLADVEKNDKGNRLAVAQWLLLKDRQLWLRQFEEGYNVRLFQVSDRLVPVNGDREYLVERIKQWLPDGNSSRLGTGLRELLTLQQGQATAAVIYITDGNTTDGPALSEVARTARRRSIPMYVIGVGSESAPQDVRLHNLLFDSQTFVGDVLHFDFQVSVSGYQQPAVRVVLRREGIDEPLAQQTLQFGEETTQSARLSYQPDSPGVQKFVLEAVPLEGELTANNNRVSAVVEVRDESIRVLMVQKSPGLEYRFLKSLLERAENPGNDRKTIDLTTILQEADLEFSQFDETAERVFPVSREELFSYDVVIFGDVDLSLLSRSVMENLVAFVEERGGGLVINAGPQHTPSSFRDSPLESLLPFALEQTYWPEPDAELVDAVKLTPTRLAEVMAFMQLESDAAASAEVWRQLPGVRWYIEAESPLAGTQVLATVPSKRDPENAVPLIMSYFFGAGRVVFHATDETYLWSRYRETETYYARYWLQLVRDLSRSKLQGDQAGVAISLDRAEYFEGDPVSLRVQFADARQAPPGDRDVQVVLQSPNGQRRQIELQRAAGRRDVFQGTLENLTEGDYRVWVAAPVVEAGAPTRRFRVLPPPGEMGSSTLDAAELRRVATITEGRYYNYLNSERLPRDLPQGRQVRVESMPTRPVWNHPWMAIILLTLLGGEWLLRKLAGLA